MTPQINNKQTITIYQWDMFKNTSFLITIFTYIVCLWSPQYVIAQENDKDILSGDWVGTYEDYIFNNGELVLEKFKMYIRIRSVDDGLYIKRKYVQMKHPHEYTYLSDVFLSKHGEEYTQSCCMEKNVMEYKESRNRFGEPGVQTWTTSEYRLSYNNGKISYDNYKHVEYVNPSSRLLKQEDLAHQKILFSRIQEDW